MKILNKAAGVAGRRLRPAEGVATNAVGARGRLSPSFISKILHPVKSPGRLCTECLFRQSKVQCHL